MPATVAAGKSSTSLAARMTGLTPLGGYLFLYAATLYGMSRWGGYDAADALTVALVLGVGFSLCAWVLTVGVKPLDYTVHEPAAEVASLLLYLVPLVAFVTWGFDAIHRMVPADPAQAVALLAAKLAVFVAVPAWMMCSRFRYQWRQLVPASARTSHMLAALGMSFLLIVFQSVAGRGFRDLQAAHLSSQTLLLGTPFAFVWLAVEAGVVEEFFFRALLQSRLSAALRSELGGIVLMALLFGLVHAPGLYLRTSATQEGLAPHPSLFMAIGYSIVITSVAGFFLGVLWARTRNFAVVVLVHAATDLIPDLLPTLRSFHFIR
jgi:membrane protease YdiL (CAAX protease family)